MTDLDPLSLEFAQQFPDSFARVLGQGALEDCANIVERLPAHLKAPVVARLPAARIDELLQSDRHSPAEWLGSASFDDAVTLLSRMPRELRLELINAVRDRNLRQRLLRHQQYPGHSVGALVRDVPLLIRADISAAYALAELRGLDTDDPGPLVVVDAEGRYLGIVDRWRLLMGNPPPGIIGDYIIDVPALRPETPIAIAARSNEWHTRNWLTVIDHERRVLGAVARAQVFARDPVAHTGMQRSSDVLADLLANVVPALGRIVETVLAPRTRP